MANTPRSDAELVAGDHRAEILDHGGTRGMNKCGSCRYMRTATRHVNYTNQSALIRECRHAVPTSSGWPSVEGDDWCAEWEGIAASGSSISLQPNSQP